MICSNCGAQNRAGRRFCAECGAALLVPCAACGTPNEPGEKFCGECGAALSAIGTEPARAPERAAPAPEAAAERRVVSVLFADLVGFTALAEGRDAEDVRDLQGRYFETVERIVARYGGTVEKYIGDAVMALWGAPVAHEDDAERAVRAALDMVDAVGHLGGDGGPGLQLRAAVLSGEAAVSIGAQGQGMVSGDLVNTASRLQSAAAPGAVLVGEATYEAAKEAIGFEPIGEQALRGKSLPAKAWRALHVIARRGGAGRADRLEPPFVGRDTELRLLKDLFHVTGLERRAHLVSIIGQAGIGKSRVAWELEKYLDGLVQTVYWHQGRSPAYGEGITFWALGEMVRQRTRMAETDDESTSREKLAAAVAEWLPDADERRWVEPALSALLGLAEAPAGDKPELFAAWRRFFERVADRGPTVLVFEELQWADPGLLDFIESLLEWSRNQPILVLGLARSELLERRPTWGAGLRNFTSLHLDPLPDARMRELLSGMVPGLPEAPIRAIVRRAEGIPLYAVETVRMLLDRGRLAADDGEYRLAGELRELEIPESLHALIAARLDALDAEERSLLQTAAVLGQSFTSASLSALRGREESDIEPLLRGLVRKEILLFDADPRSPERGQYAFVQGLMREVAYGTLAKRERRTLHLAAARHFETLGDDELAGILASHYLDAYRATPQGPEAQALRAQTSVALRAAAERAAGLGSHEQALLYLDQAMTITSDEEELAGLLEKAAPSARSAARYDEAIAYLERAVAWHRARGDRRSMAPLLASLGWCIGARGNVADQIGLLERAQAELADLSAEPGRVAVEAELARAYMLNDQPEVALEWADKVLAEAATLDLVPVIAEALITRGAALGKSGREREALAMTLGAQALAEMHGLSSTELRARYNSVGQMLAEDPRRALESAEAGYELARRLGHREWHLLFAGWVPLFLDWFGRWDEALAMLDGHLEQDLPIRDRARFAEERAVLMAFRGDIAGAERELAAVAAVEGEVQVPDDRALRHISRAVVADVAGRWEEVYQEGMATLRSSPTFAFPAYSLAATGALWLGDLDRARDAVEGHAATTEHGRFADAERLTLRAGLTALEGRPEEAAAMYRDAFERWRSLGLLNRLGRALLDCVKLLGPGHELGRAAAAEARELFARLGARGLLRLLDAQVGGAPAGVSTGDRAEEAATAG